MCIQITQTDIMQTNVHFDRTFTCADPPNNELSNFNLRE